MWQKKKEKFMEDSSMKKIIIKNVNKYRPEYINAAVI